MKTIEIARKLAELGQKEKAQEAFTLALHENNLTQEEELESASYIFFSEGDHRIAFTTFVSLFNRGLFQGDIWDLMVQAFYLPNLAEREKLYKLNCKKLLEYPYFFRSDFLDFDDLPTLFFPFDDKGFVPFDPKTNQFGDYINFNDTIIDRWFFKDLSKPVLTTDLFSQYQLEYLNDSVRPSEWVAKENHIYLHYTDWATFCAHLQVLDFSQLVKDKKFIFLFGDEISQYPFDFKERYGIDYSQNKVKPIGIREVNRLIWHAQLSTDNGGDFFNEICYGHPNLIALDSILLTTVETEIQRIKKYIRQKRKDNYYSRQLLNLKDPSDKDILVCMYINQQATSPIDHSQRIVPALFFQPHFTNIYFQAHMGTDDKTTVLTSEEYDAIHSSSMLNEFKYIKTFVPMRRFTTRYAATIRTIANKSCISDPEEKKNDHSVMFDQITDQLLNRSYLIDPDDRISRDSRVVRFEDGKLHPKATFTALAEFLDIPYTESMTYCSGPKGINPESYAGNAIGFDPRTVYATYDQYANDEERAYIEYFMRDAYEAYGYAFQYYKGEPVDESWVRDKIAHFTCANGYIQQLWLDFYEHSNNLNIQVQTSQKVDPAPSSSTTIDDDLEKPSCIATTEQPFFNTAVNVQSNIIDMTALRESYRGIFQHKSIREKLEEAHAAQNDAPDENTNIQTGMVDIDLGALGIVTVRESSAKSVQDILNQMDKTRLDYSLLLLRGLYFVNMRHQPLRLMEPLKLDPALLDGPAYH